MSDRWIKESIQEKGRVRKYLMRVYGSRAFFDNGNIRVCFLDKAIKRVRKGNAPNKTSLLRALLLAKRLKRM